MYPADNQPISARWGGADWITDFCTPKNPTVQLQYRALTNGLSKDEDIINSVWYYISHQPYVPLMKSTLNSVGESKTNKDTWFFPSEAIVLAKGNCANKSFVTASILKNHFPTLGQVYVVVGDLHMGQVGAHAWVELNLPGGSYILETTQPAAGKALFPKARADAYEAKAYFDEQHVYTVKPQDSVNKIFEAHFGVCAIPFLKDYICEKCLVL